MHIPTNLTKLTHNLLIAILTITIGSSINSMEYTKKILRKGQIFLNKKKQKIIRLPSLSQTYLQLSKDLHPDIAHYIFSLYLHASNIDFIECISSIKQKHEKSLDLMNFMRTLLKLHNHTLVAEIVHLGLLPQENTIIWNNHEIISVRYLKGTDRVYTIFPNGCYCTENDISDFK